MVYVGITHLVLHGAVGQRGFRHLPRVCSSPVSPEQGPWVQDGPCSALLCLRAGTGVQELGF